MADARRVALCVRRFDPAAGAPPRWRTYDVTAAPKSSVLDALFAVLETQDGGIAFRYSCRAGMCGSCAMVVNGREALACRIRLAELPDRITLEPLRSMPVVKDLLVDMAEFFRKYGDVAQFAGTEPSFADPATEPPPVDAQTTTRRVIAQQIDCIACGACYSACPVVGANPDFLGPAALNRAYSLAADARDTNPDRVAMVAHDGGVYGCRSVGNCVAVCPVGVDPLLSIQLLRKGAANVREHRA